MNDQSKDVPERIWLEPQTHGAPLIWLDGQQRGFEYVRVSPIPVDSGTEAGWHVRLEGILETADALAKNDRRGTTKKNGVVVLRMKAATTKRVAGVSENELRLSL